MKKDIDSLAKKLGFIDYEDCLSYGVLIDGITKDDYEKLKEGENDSVRDNADRERTCGISERDSSVCLLRV